MRKGKKKAFTLTELLVVVIVIGVLSAAVLPKFSKVIETRKTTEAEELMASVRTEQEKRCALDKQYLTTMSEMTDIVKNNDTKNFTITLASSGIDAASKGKYSYTLKMPSYADGRICCDGTECNKLNKNYPTCDELRRKPDYQESPADCAGEVVPPEEELGPCDIDPYSCECNPNQEKCCAEGEVWQDGKCVVPVPSPKTCEGDDSRACGCNKKGTQTRTCNTATGTWSDWGDCSIADTCECPLSTKPDGKVPCNDCGTKKCKVTCDETTGKWQTDKTDCGNCSVASASSCSTPSSSGDPMGAVFYAFSGLYGAYYSGDSELCGCGCALIPVTGTQILDRCSSFNEAQKICSNGGKGCLLSEIPNVPKKKIQIPSKYDCIGDQNCHYTSSLGSIVGSFTIWADEDGPSGRLYSCDYTSKVTCEGVSRGVCVDSSCKPTGCVKHSTYKCLKSLGGGPCEVIDKQPIQGYICSNYVKYSDVCSAGGYNDACGGGCGACGACGA